MRIKRWSWLRRVEREGDKKKQKEIGEEEEENAEGKDYRLMKKQR